MIGSPTNAMPFPCSTTGTARSPSRRPVRAAGTSTAVRVGPSGDQMRAIGWPASTCSPGSTSPSRSPLTGALVWSRRPLPSVVRSSSAPRAS